MSTILNIRHLTGTLAGKSQRVALKEGQVLQLGRGPDSDIKFSESGDDSVSNLHAELSLDQGRVYVEDKRSSNGTFVNGAECPAFRKVVVPDGSRLRLAQAGPEMQLTTEATQAPAGAAIAASGSATAETPKKSVGRETLLREIDKAKQEERDSFDVRIGAAQKSQRTWLSVGLAAILLLSVAGIIGAVLWNQHQAKEEAAQVAANEKAARERDKNVWADVESRVAPAVVHIRCRYRLRFDELAGGVVTGGSSGSGVLIRPGLILTARHVAEPWRYAVEDWDAFDTLFKPKPEYDLLDVQFPSFQPIRATLVASSAEHDLALLQVQQTSAPHIPTGKTNDDVKITQEIAIFGYPGGQGQYSVQVRNLSGAGDISQQITEVTPTFVPGTVAQPLTRTGDASHHLIFDASVSPGNSGGPLVNDHGELIGIVAAQFQQEGSIEIQGKKYPIRLPLGAGNLAVSPDDIQAFLSSHGIL